MTTCNKSGAKCVLVIKRVKTIMKKRLYIIFFALFSGIFLASCGMVGDAAGPEFWRLTDLGEVAYVDEVTGYFEIIRDKDGAILQVEQNAEPGYDIYKGKRVYFYYSVIEEVTRNKNLNLRSDVSGGRSVYRVKLDAFLPLLSKPIVTESFILENEEFRRDSIGRDGIYINKAWIYDDWLNIEFIYLRRQYSDYPHLVTLVWDDVPNGEGQDHSDINIFKADVAPVTGETLKLKLYHNAMGEVPGPTTTDLVTVLELASFRIADIARGTGPFDIKLSYDWYDTATFELKDYTIDLKNYTPASTNINRVITTEGVDDYIRPPVSTTTFVQ